MCWRFSLENFLDGEPYSRHCRILQYSNLDVMGHCDEEL